MSQRLPWWDAPPPPGHQPPVQYAYGVVLIEPRVHPALVWLIHDTLRKIPPSWKLLLYYHENNTDWVRGYFPPNAPPAHRLVLMQHNPYLRADTGTNEFANACCGTLIGGA